MAKDITKISIRDIYEAYRKLKNYFYYDNTSLTIRYKIAEYEQQFYGTHKQNFDNLFENAMSGVLRIVNDEDRNNYLLNSLLEKVSFKYVTKSVDKPERNAESERLITNRPQEDCIYVSKLNMLIDAPIEIHIISMLWLMFVGWHFKRVLEGHNYAYLFDCDENDDELQHGLQLFKPYYIGYQKWRDTALDTASWLLDQKKDASILCLDIQRYYYSVRLNVISLLTDVNQKFDVGVDLENKVIKRLNQLIQLINLTYTQVTRQYIEDSLKVNKEELNNGQTILPVGLLSSAVLGNLYLCDFDANIVKELNPVYYGRYVDDMLFVFSDRKIRYPETITNFMKVFTQRNILNEKGKGADMFYEFSGRYKTLKVQGEKVVLQHFYHDESRAAINKFRQNIDRQRSEFRFLPDEDCIDKEFDSDAFSLQYSDSIQKLRSLQGFSEDRFGASKFLASKIFMACALKSKSESKKAMERTCRQILNFFKGKVCIDFCTLWEKVATYFFIIDNSVALRKFVKQAVKAIDHIQGKNIPNDWVDVYKEHLREQLMLAVAQPYALHLEFKVTGFLIGQNDNCKKKAQHLRHSNMFRHNLLGVQGINYTDTLFNEEANLFDYSTEIGKVGQEVLSKLAPRHFRYDEANLLAIYACLANSKATEANVMQQEIAEKTDELFKNINYDWYGVFVKNKTYIEQYVQPVNVKYEENDRTWFVTIADKYWEGNVEKRVAIANMKVSDKQVECSMLKKADLSIERRNTLFDIINQAAKEKCDILVLPELSVPHQWLDLLVGQSKRHNMAIVAGLEYYHGKESIIYNSVATILPLRMEHVNTATINIRVKNHYSPLEKKLLKGYRYKIPEFKPSLYCLFHWRKVYFSVYNCFELANISDRSLFKSKVDFIVATELNKDVNYYADIAGSWVRDIHCYFVQVNTSHYGDSCIVQPTKTETSKIVTVKGGCNSTILVENLNIEKLRSFQFKEHFTQMDDKTYKLTPPNFDIENVRKRIENEPLFIF